MALTKPNGEAFRGYHDLGGMPADRIDPTDHDYALWERRVDAMVVQMTNKGYVRIDEHRRHQEMIGETNYATLTYYERWIAAFATLLLEKGIIHVDELRDKLMDVERRWEATPPTETADKGPS
ncbi:MAG: ScnB-like protein [Pseudomonadota bacterium]